MTTAPGDDDQPVDLTVSTRPSAKVGEVRPGPADMVWPPSDDGAGEADDQ